MKDYHKWNIFVPKSLYIDLKHQSFDEHQLINEFCRSAIDIFIAELVKLRDTTIATRQKQIEDARIASEHPLVVSGHKEERIGNTIIEQTVS